MATREYIGARYVPKFYQNSVDGSTQWQPNVVYEPLMWVTLQNSHMYISKKQVPATVGSPADNIDYWLDIGSYNGIIQEIQNDVNDLQEAVSLLTDRKFIFCGDSYGVIADNWVTKLVSILGLTSGQYYNACVSGSGFSRSGINGFLLAMQNIAGSVTDADEITDIVLVGGINDTDDGYVSANVRTGIRNFAAYCKTQFPNAKIRIGFTGYIAYDSPLLADPANTQNASRIPLVVQDYKTCSLYDIGYINGMENVLKLRSYIGSDGLHPNADGSSAIAGAIASSLFGISATNTVNILAPSVTMTPGESGWAWSAAPTLNNYIEHGDFTSFTIRGLNMGNYAGYTLADGENVIPLLNIAGLPCDECISNDYISGTACGFVSVPDYGYLLFSAPCFIKNGKMYIRLELVITGGYVHTITSIKINAVTFTAPTIYV